MAAAGLAGGIEVDEIYGFIGDIVAEDGEVVSEVELVLPGGRGWVNHGVSLRFWLGGVLGEEVAGVPD